MKTLRHDTYPAIEPSQWVATGDFTGRVVLITGASRGIGRTMASSYARAGVSGLVLVARSAGALDTAEKEVRAVHPGGELKVLKLSVNVANEKSVSEAARAVKKTFDRLDVLVNNAGVLENFTLIGQSDPSAWWTTWEVNVKGTYLVTRVFLDLLLESSSGGLEGRKTVVNVTSIGAHLTSEGGSAYQVCAHLQTQYFELMVFASPDRQTRHPAPHRIPCRGVRRARSAGHIPRSRRCAYRHGCKPASAIPCEPGRHARARGQHARMVDQRPEGVASWKGCRRQLGCRRAGCEEGGSAPGGQAEGSASCVKLIKSVGTCVCVYITCNVR